MTRPDKAVSIKIPEHLLHTLLDALNCYSDCVEGNRDSVEEAWFIDDDETLTGGTFIYAARELQDTVGKDLREIERHLIATNPELQELLHRAKMRRKHGEGWAE